MNSPQPWWLTWPVEEVAAAILPLFAQAKYHWDREVRAGIVNWCRTGSNTFTHRDANTESFSDIDYQAIAEAIQVLESRHLLLRTFDQADRSFLGLTRLGQHSLQTNTVRQHLGLADTPPAS